MYCVYNMYTLLYSIQAGPVLHQGCVPEKLMPIRTQKFPLKHCFCGVRGLTASSYMAYDYTTSGRTDL